MAAAPALLAALPLAGCLLTGDALSCHVALCRQIRDAARDYLLIVKANQPDLLWAVRTLFATPPPGEAFATEVDSSQHGDRVERLCLRRGAWNREVRYAITSLGPEVGAAALLRHVRHHWAIENRLHWVRDVTMGEDACRVRSGAAPQVLAALRNTALALARRAGWTNIAAAPRHYAWSPGAALALLGLNPP